MNKEIWIYIDDSGRIPPEKYINKPSECFKTKQNKSNPDNIFIFGGFFCNNLYECENIKNIVMMSNDLLIKQEPKYNFLHLRKQESKRTKKKKQKEEKNPEAEVKGSDLSIVDKMFIFSQNTIKDNMFAGITLNCEIDKSYFSKYFDNGVEIKFNEWYEKSKTEKKDNPLCNKVLNNIKKKLQNKDNKIVLYKLQKLSLLIFNVMSLNFPQLEKQINIDEELFHKFEEVTINISIDNNTEFQYNWDKIKELSSKKDNDDNTTVPSDNNENNNDIKDCIKYANTDFKYLDFEEDLKNYIKNIFIEKKINHWFEKFKFMIKLLNSKENCYIQTADIFSNFAYQSVNMLNKSYLQKFYDLNMKLWVISNNFKDTNNNQLSFLKTDNLLYFNKFLTIKSKKE